MRTVTLVKKWQHKGPYLGNNGLERVIGDGRRIAASRRHNEYGHVLE